MDQSASDGAVAHPENTQTTTADEELAMAARMLAATGTGGVFDPVEAAFYRSQHEQGHVGGSRGSPPANLPARGEDSRGVTPQEAPVSSLTLTLTGVILTSNFPQRLSRLRT